MKKTTLTLALLFPVTLLFSQSEMRTEFNFGFENRTNGNVLPDYWFEWGSGFKLQVDSMTKRSGAKSILIEAVAEKTKWTFGCVASGIPAVYEAKEIEVRATMKLDSIRDGNIGLMLRIDGTSGILAFENLQSQNIQGTRDWTEYSVKLPYPDDATTIYIGAINSGKGKLWVDDFKLLIDGKDIKEAKYRKPKEYKAMSDKEFDDGSKIGAIVLDKTKTEDLVVLGKVWGFLKYYHPIVGKGESNWDYELFRIVPKIMSAITVKERNAILKSWVTNLGKVEFNPQLDTSSAEIKLKPDLSWINAASLGSELVSSLTAVKDAKRIKAHYYIGQVMGVGNPEFKNEKGYNKMDYPDTGYRLLTLYRFWNIINYFFPYKNLIEEDWNRVLEEFVPRFVNARNDIEYKLTALSLIARIHDTHANIWGRDQVLNTYKGLRYAPLTLTFIENKAVVTGYSNKSLGAVTEIKVGSVIEAIDGKQVDAIIKERLSLTPASNYPTQLRDIARDLLRTNNPTMQIKYSAGGKTLLRQVNSASSDSLDLYSQFQRKDTCFKVLNSNIAYLYPGTVRKGHLEKIMPEVQKTKGLIIDFRCYPSEFIVFSLSEYLLPSPKSFVKFSTGSLTSPGLFTMTQPLKVGKENPDFYKGKVVIIINETTQSSAEYHTMAFRTAPNATVIGSTTAGADGNVSRFELPGGIVTMISGIGVYYPDGKETQRIGIVPDIEVKPTIKGVRQERDELLERAIKIVNGGK